MTRPRRSALYLPASNEKALAKVRALDCDVVILDLEDAVAPEAKEQARANAVSAIREGGFGRRELVVRANGLDTPWGRDDLIALATAGPDAILVPKVGAAEDVAGYDAAIAAAASHVQLWAMIETAPSLFKLDAITAMARASRLSLLVVGTNDLAKEMRAELDGERLPFLGALGLIVAAARSHGLGVLDGVFNAIEDEVGFERQCRQGRMFGFDGKTLIHPRQIEPCNRQFAPSEAKIAWAASVVAAFERPENSALGAIRLDGQMVERLHLDEARRLLAMQAMVA
jgi:citrate lyase subunit beta/citryl-CoA lyase